jgi:hypothetical protein
MRLRSIGSLAQIPPNFYPPPKLLFGTGVQYNAASVRIFALWQLTTIAPRLSIGEPPLLTRNNLPPLLPQTPGIALFGN